MTENLINDSDIEAKKASLMSEIAANQELDNDRFMEDAKKMQENGGDLSQLSAQNYGKEKSMQDYAATIDNGAGVIYACDNKNGQYTAVGSNGQIIQTTSLDDLNQKIAKELTNEKSAKAHFTANQALDKEWSESFAKNFIKEGIMVEGDIPESPQFWQELKQEYLREGNTSAKDWNQVTQNIPDEKLGKENTETMSTGKFLHNLRNGVNLKLTPPQKSASRTPTQVNQAQMQKWMSNSQSI